MNEEGQYRFTNGSAITTDLDLDRVKAVVMHEFIHEHLYATTTFGQIVLMLQKNSFLHDKSKEFQDVLFDYINRMQERTAVNVEIMNECILNGLEAYNAAIESLKSRNRSYYNYFRKLCCINGQVNSKDDAEVLSNILINLARLALNVNPELIPLDKMEDAKSMKRYFDNPKNNSQISPNKRFDILVNTLFRENENNNDIESVIKGSIDLNKSYDYNYIHNLSVQKVSKMLCESPYASRLIKRIYTIGSQPFEKKKGFEHLAVKPANINKRKERLYKLVVEQEEFLELLNKQAYKEIFVLHSLGGFEDFYLISVYGLKDGKNISYTYVLLKDDDFYKIISNTLCKFIFYKTKLIRKEAKSIRKMVRELPIYIFEDTPILTTLPFIQDFFFNGKFGFIENDKHYIFVVSKNSIILFADIINEAKDILISELCANSLNYIESLGEICNVNEVIRLNKTCNEYEPNDIDDVKSVK